MLTRTFRKYVKIKEKDNKLHDQENVSNTTSDEVTLNNKQLATHGSLINMSQSGFERQ